MISLREAMRRHVQTVGVVERLAPCETCPAKAGEGCRSPFGVVTWFVHKGRLLQDGSDPTVPRTDLDGAA